MNKWNKIIAIATLVILLGLAGYLFFVKNSPPGFFVSEKPKNEQNNNITVGTQGLQNYSKVLFNLERKLDQSKETQAALEIESQARQILKSDISPSEDAQAKLLIARILLYKFSDRSSIFEGMDLLKQVAKDPKYTKLWRALAFERISNTIKDVGDDENLKITLEDDYFKSMRDNTFPESGTIKNICQASFNLYPLPLCSYRIANFELYRLLEDKVYKNLNDQQRADYLNDAKEKINIAETVASKYPLEYVNLFDKGKIMFWKPFIRTKLYLLGQTGKDFMVPGNDQFEESVKIFNSGLVWPKPEGFFTYFYATSLAEVYHEEKIDKIRELTDSLVSRYDQFPELPFFLYMRNLSDQKYSSSYENMQVALLSQLNPNFKKLMLGLGWTEERLNTPFPKLP